MAVEGDQGRWLRAKAQQLKERALGTADTTRRKQFLLIATEYQKLARQEDGALALGVIERAIAPSDRTSHLGVVTRLRSASQQTTAMNPHVAAAPAGRPLHWFRWHEAVDVAIWAVLALVAFALLLMPGDQTTRGLQEAFELLVN